MQIIEISRKKFAPASESEKAKSKALIEKMRKEGEKLIRGMFEFVDAQGGWLDFSFRFFPGEPIRTIKINHGEIVDIPILLAKHLNNVYKKVRMMPDNADMGKASVTKISRTRFTPMDMLGEDVLRGDLAKAAV
jgi:hypothetical protein